MGKKKTGPKEPTLHKDKVEKLKDLFLLGGMTSYKAPKQVKCDPKTARFYFIQFATELTEDEHHEDWFSREQGRKIIGASGHEELDMDAMVTHMINIAALALTTASLNAGIVSANNAVSQLHEPKFLFNTVGDDRVCPICEPFDNETMKESDGSLHEPPLHDSCRCYLIPLV